MTKSKKEDMSKLTCLRNGSVCSCTRAGYPVCDLGDTLYTVGIGHNGGPKMEDAFELPRRAVINCDKTMCGELNCTDCYPNAPLLPKSGDFVIVDDITAPTAPVVNPKELAGAKKPASWSVMPRWVMLQVGRVMSVGAAKYGAFNYRDSSISASIYQDAMERHLQLWFDGEDMDDETGVSHLASVIASCALLMDAQATGKLNDDRQKTGIVREQLKALEQLLIDLPLPQPKTGA